LFFGQLAFTVGFLEDDSGTVLREFSNADGAKLRIHARNLHVLSRWSFMGIAAMAVGSLRRATGAVPSST
jgi:hypothetical protein